MTPYNRHTGGSPLLLGTATGLLIIPEHNSSSKNIAHFSWVKPEHQPNLKLVLPVCGRHVV